MGGLGFRAWSLDLEFGGYLLNSGEPDGPENRVT